VTGVSVAYQDAQCGCCHWHYDKNQSIKKVIQVDHMHPAENRCMMERERVKKARATGQDLKGKLLKDQDA
jgi:hypothetical protein